MEPVTLYQFELCPYCHKVKAGLDIKGVPYKRVEVNPMTKKELPELPADAPKKVPVMEANGDRVYDSTAILSYLDTAYPDTLPLLPSDPAAREKTVTIERWVDDDLSCVLPTVIYGTWRDAIRAAKVVAKTSNFGPVQNAVVRAGGSLIMHSVAKRIIKRRGGSSPQQMLADEVDKFETWLGNSDFVCGDTISLGDIATHGCLTCIAAFPAFDAIMKRPKVKAWYDRVAAARQQRAAN